MPHPIGSTAIRSTGLDPRRYRRFEMTGFVRRNGWIIPVVFAALLAGVGWRAYATLEQGMKAQIASRLETLRNSTTTALVSWADRSKAVVEVHAARPEIREESQALLELGRSAREPRAALLRSPVLASLRERLEPVVEKHGFEAWAVVDPTGLFVAARTDRNIGRRVPGVFESTTEMMTGPTIVTPPTLVRLLDQQPIALVLIGGPLRDENGEPIATFGFSIDPQKVYGDLLVAGRPGRSGETYAFDADGVLISPSRFEEQLREIGLLRDDPAVTSSLNIEIRDPGGNLAEGFAPKGSLKSRPFTAAAASAIAGESGVDADGFRDYRGVPVLAAWTWVPELGVGITTEIEAAEAFAELVVLREQFVLIVGLLVLGAVGMFVYSFAVMRLRREVDAARQVGRYRIERKLGEGGMGTVYLARHALLRRPTAIKILSADKAGEEGLARFEREVQVSSSLSHPNTIEIYDFGHTPEGTFYYAMEYVNGLTLSACVEAEGPLPEARVVHLMKQACASISESHARGLMHRDIKPANVMVCERGGAFDFVKVLDFGLVKEMRSSQNTDLTDVASITGTPAYIPPEAAEAPDSLDVRGDVYQLGLIAWFLLVGHNVFEGESAVDVILQHVSAPPKPPSEALGRPVWSDLEKVILRCLEKKPESRWADAGALLQALEECGHEGAWTQRDAREWWEGWRQRHPEAEESDPSSPSFPSGYDVELDDRVPAG